MRVHDDPRTPVAHRLQRVGARADHHIAGEQHVRLLRIDAHLVQPFVACGKAHVRQHRAALLCKPHEIEHRRALALEMRGHTDERADRHDAGAADARHQNVVRRRIEVRGRLRQRIDAHRERRGVECDARRLFQRAAFDRDEARAKAVHTRIVLVAGRLIDTALTPKRRLDGLDRQAVRLHAAIATAFTDGFVDEEPFVRVGEFALLAAAALFGRAGLVVDQHGDAVDIAQLPLHGIEFAAVMERGALRKQAVVAVILFRLVADHDEVRNALRFHLPRDLRHRDAAVDGLSACHCNCVVVENLVGDRRFCGDRLADRQNAGVEVGAVAEILEHVARLREHRMRGPVDAFAAHLDQPGRIALHPRRHEVAANTGLRD
ncbi:hypothetical protein LMG29542_08593 [Paraburkholderia humisilvae]|uniref:Uncharacterized protein n=1 Tax=Paraburkholderia humisilvae TaxID=627669 RepID=A0A6J5FBP7_9BURK|nr:hypothetical protein LMG29542_08593 [Paraburkholderia humisilvae]